MITYIQIGMATCLFLLGLASCIAGFVTILSRKYQQALRNISAHSTQISSKAITDSGLVPLVEAMSGLVRSIDQLVRTSVGVGVFLCMAGATFCAVAYWMLFGF